MTPYPLASSRDCRHPARDGEAGLTIVELLISVLLFAVLSAGALVVLSGQQRGLQVQQSSDNTLESARATLDALTRQLQLVKSGIPNGRLVLNANHTTLPSTATQCGSGIFPVIEVVNSSTGPDGLRVLVPDGAAWGTLATDLAEGDNQVQVRTIDGVAPAITNAQWMVVTSFTDAVLIRPQNAPSACGTNLFCTTKLPGDWNGTSTIVSGGVLLRARWLEYGISSTQLGTSTYPSLIVTQKGADDSSQTEPAALGIEDIQIALGIDLNGDGVIGPEVAGVANADEWIFNAAGETITSAGVITSACELENLREIRVSVVALGSSGGGRNVAGGRPALEDRPAGASDDLFRVVLRTAVALR